MEASAHFGAEERVSGPGWSVPNNYEGRDPEKPPITEDQAAAIERERAAYRLRVRNRLIGYAVIAFVVAAIAVPLLSIVGFEAGLFTWFFNLGRHI